VSPETLPTGAFLVAEPIAEYHKLVFRTQKDADHAVTLLLDWATIDAGSRVGPNRIVVWQETIFRPKPWGELDHSPAVMAATVYLSPGALARLERLMPVPLPASEAVQPSDLPMKRVLMMVGDAEYWGWAIDSLG
jgi:hypothetical protein